MWKIYNELSLGCKVQVLYILTTFWWTFAYFHKFSYKPIFFTKRHLNSPKEDRVEF